jgi:hypothetical protein
MPLRKKARVLQVKKTASKMSQELTEVARVLKETEAVRLLALLIVVLTRNPS